MSFSAHDGPNGFSGHVRSHPGPDAPRVVFTDFSGPVTCVLVEGNRAVVGGVIAKSTVEENVGKTFMFAVEDNGNPSDATADRLSAYFIFPPEVLDPEDCTAGTELYAFLAPITSGNLSVYDAL